MTDLCVANADEMINYAKSVVVVPTDFVKLRQTLEKYQGSDVTKPKKFACTLQEFNFATQMLERGVQALRARYPDFNYEYQAHHDNTYVIALHSHVLTVSYAQENGGAVFTVIDLRLTH